jgi:hypothetical protein
MSREQLNDHESQGAGPAQAEVQGDVQGLPPNLYQQASQIRPGDVQGLRDLLTLFPDFAPQILAVVSPRAGLSTVKQAQAQVQQNAVGRGGALTSQQIHAGGEFAIEGSAPVAGPEVAAPAQAAPPQAAATQAPAAPGTALDTMELSDVPLQDHVRKAVLALHPGDAVALQQVLNLYPSMSDAILTLAKQHVGVETVAQAVVLEQELAAKNRATADKKSHESTDGDLLTKTAVFDDLPGARKYNESHPEFVEEFNRLTQNVFCVSETAEMGALDPLKVAGWQAHRGLAADGKVGPHTVAAARRETSQSVISRNPDTAARSEA